jgi:hypothetical protein
VDNIQNTAQMQHIKNGRGKFETRPYKMLKTTLSQGSNDAQELLGIGEGFAPRNPPSALHWLSLILLGDPGVPAQEHVYEEQPHYKAGDRICQGWPPTIKLGKNADHTHNKWEQQHSYYNK